VFLADKEWIILKPGTSVYERLASAIRRGCKMAPRQAFNAFSYGGASACVSRAATLGGFHVEPGDGMPLLPYPCQCSRDMSTAAVLPHLNDVHRWTRERIADWLEGLG